MGFVIDSNAPYFTEFPLNSVGDAVYMTAEDELLGNVFAVVYRAHPGIPKLSVILIGAHGTSGFVDMTLDRSSRYYGACKGLAKSHFKSPVRRALAIAALRTYATMDKPLRQKLQGVCDESAAGALGSKFRLVYGKFPSAIGTRMIDAGLISPKTVGSAVVDIVYEDSDFTIDQNNELVYLLGEQLEQLFDPLSEYSPEPTERVYVPPSDSDSDVSRSLDSEPQEVQDICEQLYLLQAHSRGDILDFLQTTLIPLRVEVLKGSFPGLTIARLNTVFPPTIDELFRVNNIFYEALRAALPFGAFEVVRACGTTVPYFFRACMRHEAATQNFSAHLDELLAEEPGVRKYLKSNLADITAVIRNQHHLPNIRHSLDSLVSAKRWDETQKSKVDEFYAVASGTVDAFDPTTKSKEKLLMSSGNNILGSVAQDWPPELDEGASTRRVVTIFDAVDILEPNESVRQLHMVFIVFTDVLVVCRPSEPIPSTSLSGLHIPSVGDMLLHAMLNEAAIDRNLPPLKVVAWSPVLDVYFASFDRSQHLYINSPSLVGSYKLLQPDSNAASLVSLLAKAKITMKTRPFHLFKIDGDGTTIYSTVQELQGYKEEENKTSVAIFLSTEVTERTLNKYGLVGAMGLSPGNNSSVSVQIVSKLGYNATFEVDKKQLQELVVNESSYLLTLSLSSQNAAMLDSIILANQQVANRLINWASQRDAKQMKGHKRVIQPQQQANLVIPSASVDSLKPVNKTVRRTTNLPLPSSSGQVTGNSPVLSVDEEISGVSYNTSDSLYTSEYSSEETEQRDVDNWYHQLHSQRDNDSLSTELSEHEETGRPPSSQHSESIQIGGFLNRSASNLYNRNAGRAFPRIESSIMEAQPSHIRSSTESSFETIASLSSSSNTIDESWISQDTTVPEEEDFSYLASLVNSTSLSKLSELERSSAYPSLRDTSLVRLGSRIVRRDKPSVSAIEEVDVEATPKLGSEYVAATERELADSEYDESAEDEVANASVVNGGNDGVVSGKDTTSGYTAIFAPHEPLEQDEHSLDTPKITEDTPATEEPERPKFNPFVDVESANWLPAPIYQSYKQQDPFSPKYKFIYEMEDGSLGDRGSYELAENWLAWTANSRPTSMVSSIDAQSPNRSPNQSPNRSPHRSPNRSSYRSSYRSLNELLNQSPYRSPNRSSQRSPNRSPVRTNVPSARSPVKMRESQSHASFRRMVMSSSLHTLQLASFVNQLEQKMTVMDNASAAELNAVKQYVTYAYTSTATPESELETRRKLCGCHMLLLKLQCHQLAEGLLEIEWVRRSRVAETTGNARELWKYQQA